MTDTLTEQQFSLAIAYMQTLPTRLESDGAVQHIPRALPYGAHPGQVMDGSIVPLNNMDAWDAYVWNPPEHDTSHADTQDDVAAKPTWDELVQWATAARRQEAIERLDAECSTRITRGYGEKTSQAEWQFRLRAAETGASQADRQRLAAGNTERDRLRARYKAISKWIGTLNDIDRIEQLDFSDADYWAASWTPPDPAG